MDELISRQAAIDAIESAKTAQTPDGEIYVAKINAEMNIQILPSAQPEQTDCDYCHENCDGFVKPIEKNCHAAIHGSVLYLKAKGWHGEAQIKYCPMCGRRLKR